MIKTVIFEDTEIDVRGIKSLIQGFPEIRVVASFKMPRVALDECKKIKPELIIADAEILGDKNAGPTFVRSVKKQLPDVKILGLTRYAECLQPLKNAGCNYVALKQFLENEDAAMKFIRETLLDPLDDRQYPPPVLTDMEDQVLRMIVDGQTEKEVGEQLGYSRRQVRRIKDSLFDKFGAMNVAQLVAHAYQTGYLKPDEEM